MNKLVINFKNIEATEEDIQSLNTELSRCDDKLTLSKSSSFNGFSDIIIVLSIGGGVAIKQIGSIVINWINRHKGKKIKYKNLEATGYSSEEFIKMINEIEE